jgi:hypothetical protein
MKKLIQILLLSLLALPMLAQEVDIRPASGGGAPASPLYTSNDNMVSNFDPPLASFPLQPWAECWDSRRGSTYRWNGTSWQSIDSGLDDGSKASTPYTVTNPAGNIATGWNPNTHNKMRINYTTAGVDTFFIDTIIFTGILVPGEIFTIVFSTQSRTADADTVRIHFNKMWKNYYGQYLGEWICPPRGTMTMNFQVDVSVEGATLREIDDIMGNYGHGGGGGGGSLVGAAEGLSVDAGTVELGNDKGETSAVITADRIIGLNSKSVKFTGDGGIQIGGNDATFRQAVLDIISDGTPQPAIRVRGANQGFQILLETDTAAALQDRVDFVLKATPGGLFPSSPIKDYTYFFGIEPNNPTAADSLGTFGLSMESAYRQVGGGSGPGNPLLAEYLLIHNYIPSHVSVADGTRWFAYVGAHNGSYSSAGFQTNIFYNGDLEQRRTITYDFTGNVFNTERMRIENGMFMQWDSAGFWPMGQTRLGSFRGLIRANNDATYSIGQSGDGYIFDSNGAANLWPGLANASFNFGTSGRRIGSASFYTNNQDGIVQYAAANTKAYAFEQPSTGWQLRNITDNLTPLFIQNGAPTNAMYLTSNGVLSLNAGNVDLGRLVISGQRGTVGLRLLNMNDANGYSMLAAGVVTGNAFMFGGNMSCTGNLTGEIFNNNSASTAAHARVQIRTANTSSDPYTQYSAAGSPDNWATGVNSTDSYAFRIQLTGSDPTTAAQGFRMATNGQVRFSNYTSAAAFTGTTSHFVTQAANGDFITKTAADFRTDVGIVDNSITNEGALSVAAGGSNDAQIVSNTSGSTPVNVAGGNNIKVVEAGAIISIYAEDTVFVNLTPLAFTDSLKTVSELGKDYFNVPAELNGFKIAKVEYSAIAAGAGSGGVTVGIRAYSNTRTILYSNGNSQTFSAGEFIKTSTGSSTLTTGQLLVAQITGDTIVTHPRGLGVVLMLTK